MNRFSKYKAKREFIDGIEFDSMKEAKRYRVLKQMQNEGLISDLQTQVEYVLLPKTKKTRATKYIADFVYMQNGEKVVEDCKGYKTDVYMLKKKMMYVLLGIEIKES